MLIRYDDIDINYELYGSAGENLLFLHGWGGSTDSFKCVANRLCDKHRCLLIDFPPFGKSEEPYNVWELEDYTQLIIKICEKEKLKKITIIAHSFGGRVAILIASRYNELVNKLVLVDSAGLKPKFSIKKLISVLKFKIAKLTRKINLNSYGSGDYKKLSPMMKKTFVNIIKRDLKQECKNIKCPTLIVFGEIDKETPLRMGKKLRKLIKNSALITIKNVGHYSYLEDYYKFMLILDAFLKG